MRKSLLAAIAYVCCIAPIGAHELPIILATDTQPACGSLTEAVTQGLIEANKHRGVEYGGVVYQIGDHFYYSDPVTLNETSDIGFKVRFAKGTHVVALYHSHPVGPDSDWFSETDIKTARDLKLPSYIVVQVTNTVRLFTPGVDSVRSDKKSDEPHAKSQLIATGKFVATL